MGSQSLWKGEWKGWEIPRPKAFGPMKRCRLVSAVKLATFLAPYDNVLITYCLSFQVFRGSIFWVRSIGKSGFIFWNSDFGFAIERAIRKWISTLRYLFLDFHFWKTVLKNSRLPGARIFSKTNNTVHENSFANPFSVSQSNRKKEIHEIRIWIFLIEIHPEDGFLGGQIRFRISRSIGKSGFRFWKSKSGFPNRTHPLFLKSACVSKGWCKFKFKLEILEEFCMNPPGSVEDLKKLHFTWDSEATFYGFWFTLRKR